MRLGLHARLAALDEVALLAEDANDADSEILVYAALLVVEARALVLALQEKRVLAREVPSELGELILQAGRHGREATPGAGLVRVGGARGEMGVGARAAEGTTPRNAETAGEQGGGSTVASARRSMFFTIAGTTTGAGGAASPAGAVVDIPRGSVEEFEAWRGRLREESRGGRATAARRARGECATGGKNHDAHLSRPFRNPPWTAVDGVGFDRRLGRARGSTRAPLTGGSASERFSSDEPRCKAFPSPRAAHFHAAPTRGGVSPVQAYPARRERDGDDGGWVRGRG